MKFFFSFFSSLTSSLCLLLFSVGREMAKPIETTTAPPHRSPPIDPTPIKTTTDPPNRHRSSTDPSSMTISRGSGGTWCLGRLS
ncbi:unnamed protein product [Brassica rapa subsp. trilocularis]